MPITLPFAANSPGKARFALRSLSFRKVHVGGKSIDLGGFKQLVHQDDDEAMATLKLPIRVHIDLSVSQHELKSFYPEIDQRIAGVVADIGRYKFAIRRLYLVDGLSLCPLFNEITTA